MLDVCIAVTKRLWSRRETSINETDFLPLGNHTVTIRPKFNDDTFITVSKSVHIKDVKSRNDQYLRQELIINERSLVGKKSSSIRPIIHDVGTIQKFNENAIKRATDLEINHHKLENFNLVSFPFTTADNTDVNTDITS